MLKGKGCKSPSIAFDSLPLHTLVTMNKKKLFNDPVYGFVTIPYEIIFDLIEHPAFQRLRHISQLGLTHLIYPGALHTRFHHAIGALHLMTLAIDTLRSKGVMITEEEAEAVCIAILLHDIGHGPFSHALEGRLVGVPHEDLSLILMQDLNQEFEGALDRAIAIFTGAYPKHFLHQLISSQLDMDRMDYLNRDSFYSGVMEGKIGFDRIIKMLQVRDDQLVVEEKGIYSIEKFLVARKIMYWQVYQHKTVLAAELMLIAAIERVRYLYLDGQMVLDGPLADLLKDDWQKTQERSSLIDAFLQLDDHDIVILLKNSFLCGDYILRTLAKGLIQRKLFSLELSLIPFKTEIIEETVSQIAEHLDLSEKTVFELTWSGSVRTDTYSDSHDEIKILLKDGKVLSLSDIPGFESVSDSVEKYYFCHLKV